jgi:4-amino-4-deoxy-L-arabinose transferase-like glycosyltransferase
MKTSQNFLEILLLVIVALAIFLPRSLKLDQFVTTDEEVWLVRSANFYQALAGRDFAYTYQREHPGVTTMWAGMAAFLLRYPEYRGSGVGQLIPKQFINYLEKNSPVQAIELLTTARWFMVVGITITLLLAFLYTRRIVGFLPALIAILLVAFDPFYLALTRLLHLDGLLAALMFLSLVSFLSYLKDRRWLDLLVSGASAGLSWLTKSPGFFLAFAIAIIACLAFIQQETKPRERWSIQSTWRFLWPVIAWGITGVLVYFLLWPAMWVDPIGTVQKIFLTAIDYAVQGHDSSIFFNGEIIPSGDLGLRYAYFYPLTYLWRTTPVVLLGLLAATWGYLTRRKPFHLPIARLTVLGMFTFSLVFTLIMTLGLKKFDRYLIPIFLPLNLIAGMGLAAVIQAVMDAVEPRWKKWVLIASLAIVLGIQLASAASTYPYYLTYYNPLLGGSRRAAGVMQIGWGEGLDLAARYLNEKPDADRLTVYAWYSRGCLSYLFDGKTFDVDGTFGENPGDMDKLLKADYLITYVHQWQRDIPSALLEFLKSRTPEKTFSIDGIEYVRIYRLN